MFSCSLIIYENQHRCLHKYMHKLAFKVVNYTKMINLSHKSVCTVCYKLFLGVCQGRILFPHDYVQQGSDFPPQCFLGDINSILFFVEVDS